LPENLANQTEHEKWARVHFIPNPKEGEFVTLRTPYILKLFKHNIYIANRKEEETLGWSWEFQKKNVKIQMNSPIVWAQ
jgi:hypothetical protein